MQAAKPGKDIDFSSEKPASSRFPPRGQDMSDAGGSHIMRTKRRWQNDSYDRVPARQRK